MNTKDVILKLRTENGLSQDELAAKVKTLTDEAAAAAGNVADDVKTQLDALQGEKDELLKQVENLKGEATKAADDAAAALKAVTDEKDALVTKVDELTKKIEEATDFANMDEKGLKDIIKKLTDPLKKIGYEITKSAGN